jgi:hypothetical protein
MYLYLPTVARQLLDKGVTAATNTQPASEELLYAICFVSKKNNVIGVSPNFLSLESVIDKRIYPQEVKY